MRASTFMVLLVAVCLALSAAALPLKQRKSPPQRVRRKIGQLNSISSTPLEYMRNLLLKIDDEEGKPKNPVEDPLTVWCFMDEDVVEGTVREKLQNSAKCTSVSRYVFQWELLTLSGNHLVVEKGILRAYMKVISRLMTDGEAATVTVAVSVNTMSNKSNMTTVNLEESAITDQQQINVTTDSNGWQEINITNALRSIWPPNEDTPIVEIVLRLEVNCKERKKVPVSFVNPAEISLEQVNRRNRSKSFQPLMVVFLRDNEMKVKEEEAVEVVEAESDVTLLEGERRRRTTPTHSCRVENFTVNFGDLGLDHVLLPASANIKRCSGSCSHTAIKLNGHMATNHAKVMASQSE